MPVNCDPPTVTLCICCAEQHKVVHYWCSGDICLDDCEFCGAKASYDELEEIICIIELPEKHPLIYLNKVQDKDIIYATEL